jgi:hypothetical protein
VVSPKLHAVALNEGLLQEAVASRRTAATVIVPPGSVASRPQHDLLELLDRLNPTIAELSSGHRARTRQARARVPVPSANDVPSHTNLTSFRHNLNRRHRGVAGDRNELQQQLALCVRYEAGNLFYQRMVLSRFLKNIQIR